MFSVSRFAVLFFLFAVICPVMSSDHEKENPIMGVVKKTLHATAHRCMDQTNATEADLEYLRDDPPYPEKAACIIKCLLEKVGIVKNNKYSKAGFTTAVTPLVFRNKKKLEHMKTVSDNCDKEFPIFRRCCKRHDHGVIMISYSVIMALATAPKYRELKNKINHHVISQCEIGNEIVTCIFKYAPELHFSKSQ